MKRPILAVAIILAGILVGALAVFLAMRPPASSSATSRPDATVAVTPDVTRAPGLGTPDNAGLEQEPAEPPVSAEAPEAAQSAEAEDAVAVTAPEEAAQEPAAAGKPRLAVTGRVTLASGEPAVGATIRIETPKNLPIPRGPQNVAEETTSAEDGSYVLDVEDAPALLLTAGLDGHGKQGRVLLDQEYWQRQSTGAAAKSRTVKQDFVLDAEAVFAGVVQDTEGEPIAGATLTAMRRSDSGLPAQYNATLNIAESFEAKSDAEGAFAFEQAPPGTYLLRARAADYVSSKSEVTVPAASHVVTLDKTGAAVSGAIFRKETGEPVEGVLVSVHSAAQGVDDRLLQTVERPPSMTTGVTGEFTFENLPAGTYAVSASKEKLQMVRDGAGSFELVTGQTLTGQDVFLYGGSNVRGTVYNETTREPLAGVTIDTNVWGNQQHEGPSDVSDENGNFYLSGVFGNMVWLRAQKEGFTMVKPQEYQPGVQVEIDPEVPEATVVIDMVPSVRVSGIVRRADNVPVTEGTAGWRTSMGGGEISSALEKDGTFSFEVPPRSAGAVIVRVPGFHAANSEMVTVLERDVTGIEIVLEEPGALMGRVIDPDGRPVEDAEVQVYYLAQIDANSWGHSRTGEAKDSKQTGQCMTSRGGAFSFQKVAPGEINVTASKEGYSDSERKTLLLKPGELKTNVEIQLNVGHFLRGTVVDQDDAPIEGAQIHAYSNNYHSGGNLIRTDSNGRFELTDLPAGSINLTISHQSGSKSFQNEAVDRDDAVFKLDNEQGGTTTGNDMRAMLVGSVVDDATGAPVEGIRVEMDRNYGGNYRPIIDREVPGLFRIDRLYPRSMVRFTITAPDFAALQVSDMRVPADQAIVRQTYRMKKGGAIIGRVVGSDGQPVASFDIALKGIFNQAWEEPTTPLAIATTGEDGRFEFKNVSEGMNTLRFLPAAGFAELVKKVGVTNGQTADLGDVVLDAGRIARVQVVRMPGRTPMAGQVLKLSKTRSPIQGETRETDRNGVAVFEGLSNEEYMVEHMDSQLRLSWRDASSKELSGVLPIGSGTLRGKVVEGDKPLVANIQMNATWEGNTLSTRYGLQSDGDGIFTRENLVGADWNVNLNVQGPTYRHMAESVSVADTGITEHTFAFPGGTLTGRIQDAAGQPVEGALVQWQAVNATPNSIYNVPTIMTTEADGVFSFSPLPEGLYNVKAEASAKGRGTAENISVPNSGASAPAIITLVRTGGGTLISTAYDYATGEGLVSAWCYLTNTETGERLEHLSSRGTDGIMRVDDVPAGTYSVEVSAWGYSIGTHNVTMPEGGIQEVSDVLYVSGALRWSLVGPGGEPLTGITCTLTPNDPASIETVRRGTTDASGQFVVRGLWPGMYTAEATIGAGQKVTKEVQISAHALSTEQTQVP